MLKPFLELQVNDIVIPIMSAEHKLYSSQNKKIKANIK